MQNFPTEAGATIAEALDEAVKQASEVEEIAFDDISCARDYSLACPEGVCFACTPKTY